jgi:hypothetical protein
MFWIKAPHGNEYDSQNVENKAIQFRYFVELRNERCRVRK